MRGDLAILALIEAGRLHVDAEHGLVFAPKSNTPEKSIGAVTKKGYLRACINVSGKQMHFMVHRIVWVSVHGPVPPGHQIDHRDTIKSNNRISNLEAVTGLVNMRRAAKAGLTNGGWREAHRDKATGQFVGKKHAGRLLDGVQHDGYPGNIDGEAA